MRTLYDRVSEASDFINQAMHIEETQCGQIDYQSVCVFVQELLIDALFIENKERNESKVQIPL